MRKLARLAMKILHDIATSFYDDLEFKEFSSVRLGFYTGLTLLVVTWYQVLFRNKDVSILIAVTGAPLISVVQYIGKKTLDNQRARITGERHEQQHYGHTE